MDTSTSTSTAAAAEWGPFDVEPAARPGWDELGGSGVRPADFDDPQTWATDDRAAAWQSARREALARPLARRLAAAAEARTGGPLADRLAAELAALAAR